MAYRDDADAVRDRALALQHELDELQHKLSEREGELARLRGDFRRVGTFAVPPPLPSAAEPVSQRGALLETARKWLESLDDRALVMVGAIIEELATEPANREAMLGRLEQIVEQITAGYQPKR